MFSTLCFVGLGAFLFLLRCGGPLAVKASSLSLRSDFGTSGLFEAEKSGAASCQSGDSSDSFGSMLAAGGEFLFTIGSFCLLFFLHQRLPEDTLVSAYFWEFRLTIGNFFFLL